MSLTKQGGTAIIVALFLVGLVAALAITMMERLNRDLRRTELLLQSTQADLYAQGSLAWGLDTLRYHWLNQKKNEVIDKLPLSSPVNTLQQFTVASTLYDDQAHFNLNNLGSEEWSAPFQRLLLLADPTLSSEKAQQITKSTLNWISPVAKNIDDDLYYMKLPQAYRAPHRPMASASEFRLIKGVTPEIYARLLPYLTALPELTLINVNTAAPLVLQSLSPALTSESAQALANYRRQNPFVSLEQFSAMDLVRNNMIPATLITVNSQYFLISTQVKKNKQQLLLLTLAKRSGQNNKASLHILWQSKGGI
jgi:general secretion pathway protein K